MRSSFTSTAYHAGRHCTESEILDRSRSCPICGFSGNRKLVLTIQRRPDVSLLECPNCAGISASSMPKPETLAEYYGSYRQNTALKVTFFSPERFARHILQIAGNRWNEPTARILDFGGGDGALGLALADQLLASKGGPHPKSVNIDLIDYSQRPARPSTPLVSIRQLASLDQAGKDSYDLVIASSVIEHIPEPLPVLRDLFAALRVNGCFYARTPWIVPILQILSKLKINFDFTFPAHVHDLGKTFWEHMDARVPDGGPSIRLVHSRPSIVETRFMEAPVRTLLAHALKSSWRLMPAKYNLVGGWEVMFERVR